MKLTREEYSKKLVEASSDIANEGNISVILLTATFGAASEDDLFKEDDKPLEEIDRPVDEICESVFKTAAELTLKLESPFALPIFTSIATKFCKLMKPGKNAEDEEGEE